MSEDLLLSLCIPTNGVSEWVFPVLDSIYDGNEEGSEFEVIVTDNGNNQDFETKMNSYCDLHSNLVYKKTNAVQFLNQIEAFKLAKGTLIKFVNHRQKVLPGAIEYLLSFVRDNKMDKPIVFFMNEAQKGKGGVDRYSSFDEYVRGLGVMSSWSGGTAMWKSDFEKMNLENSFNQLFPHTDMIFAEKNRTNYIIEHKKLFEEIEVDDTKKGRYNLFNAFAIEYVSIILDLYRNGYVSKSTFIDVKRENAEFIAQLYYKYLIRKQPCSYDLSEFDESIKFFYSKGEIRGALFRVIRKTIIGK